MLHALHEVVAESERVHRRVNGGNVEEQSKALALERLRAAAVRLHGALMARDSVPVSSALLVDSFPVALPEASLSAAALSIQPTSQRAMTVVSKAQLLLGRALDSTPRYSAAAERALTAAVKLAPRAAPAWAALAHCLFKKDDLAGAERCLRESLALTPSAEAWRLLSQLLRRSKSAEGVAYGERLRESVAAGCSAVATAPEDYRGWLILANAYLAAFVASRSRATDVLTRAIKAYAQAVRREAAAALIDATAAAADSDAAFENGASVSGGGASCDDGEAVAAIADAAAAVHLAVNFASDVHDADLHHNFAIALSLAAEYASALTEYRLMCETGDRKLADMDRRSLLLEHVFRMADICSRTRAEKAGRELNALAAACAQRQPCLSAAAEAVLAMREPVMVNALAAGTNSGVYVVFKPLMPITSQATPPRCDYEMIGKEDDVLHATSLSND